MLGFSAATLSSHEALNNKGTLSHLSPSPTLSKITRTALSGYTHLKACGLERFQRLAL